MRCPHCDVCLLGLAGTELEGRYNRQIRLLHSIQKDAAKAISGGFRTVAKDAFNAELQLMPMKYRAELRITTSMARIASSPIYPHIAGKRAHHSRQNQAWRSPLDLAEESCLLKTGIGPQGLETRHPFPIPPWWTPPPIYIEKNPLDSMINHEKCIALTPRHWRIYWDQWARRCSSHLSTKSNTETSLPRAG